MLLCCICFFFFFKQKTAYDVRISDWSSDVCSSDLVAPIERRFARRPADEPQQNGDQGQPDARPQIEQSRQQPRADATAEQRLGKRRARAEQRGRCQGDWGAGPGDPALDRHPHTPATGAFAGPASRRPCTHRYNAGNTRRVSKVEEMTPPITTVAKGRCTSAPAPTLNAIGTKPRLATSAVISTGRSRVSAPSRTAPARGPPCAVRDRLELSRPA